MGLFAALMTYLVAAALLVGSAVAGLTVLLAPSETLTARSAPPLIRAADRKPQQPPKTDAKTEAAPHVRVVTPPVAAAPIGTPSGPVANRSPAIRSQSNTTGVQGKTNTTGAQAKKAEATAQPPAAPPPRPAKKKKIVKKSAPTREADTGSLGYNPEPRRFVFPFDPGW